MSDIIIEAEFLSGCTKIMARYWPEGLDDKGALVRIQSLLINVAEGRRHIAEDRQYAELRKTAKGRLNLKDLLPDLIIQHKSLDSFSAFIREIDSRSLRVEMVRSEFRELLRQIDATAASGIEASAWTGKPTKVQQAVIVRAASLRTIKAIDVLLAEQELRHSNGGPVAPEEEAAINRLKELRSAVDELIKLAEADQPWNVQGRKIALIGRGALKDFTSSLSSDVNSVAGAATPVMLAGLTYALAQSLFGMSVEGAAMLGASAVTGQVTRRWTARKTA